MKSWPAAAILVLLPLQAFAQGETYAPYHARLAKECRAQKLEFLSPAALDDRIAGFEAALPKTTREKLERAGDAACRDVSAGATCGNVASLKAMNKAGLLARFAHSVCASGLSCRAQSDCGKS
jgi:hypothetical protein